MKYNPTSLPACLDRFCLFFTEEEAQLLELLPGDSEGLAWLVEETRRRAFATHF